MGKPKVIISILTEEDTRQDCFGTVILQTFFEEQLIRPEFVSNFEPINIPVSEIGEALPYWAGMPFLWKRKHKIVSQGFVHHSGAHGAGSIIFDAMYVPSFDWVSLFKNVISRSNAIYGYLHLITDVERTKSKLLPQDAHHFFLGAFAKNVESGFADLAWANYFGSKWSDDIDLARLAREHANVERSNNGYIISVGDSLSDVITDYESFDDKRKSIKSAFSKSFFRATPKD